MMRIKNVTEIFNKLLIFISILLGSLSVFAVTGRTTYQAKIIKPDGFPLEASAVNFRFTILDPIGTCVLYSEDYAAINMSGTGGLISFSLGSGTRSYPVSLTTFASVFDNSSPAFACQTSGVYSPTLTDNRKIVMQFQDVSGWQTLPAMSINSVPFAMYAEKSLNAVRLNGKADTEFVENATLAALNCNSTTHALTFNGASFSCLAVGSGGGGGGVTSVTTSGTVLSAVGTASAPVITIQAATVSQDGYLTSFDYMEFKAKLSASSTQIVSALGYAPVSGSAVTSQIINTNLSGDVSGTVSANSVVNVGGKSSSQISNSVDDTLASTTSATANTIVKRNSSGSATFGDVYASAAKLSYVDIYKPSTSFNIRLQAPASLSSDYILSLPATSGTAGQVLSADGAGNLSWVSPSAQWTTSGTAIFYNTGKVGIGTSNPTSLVHVSGTPVANANYGLVSLGNGPFDGSSSGFFTGHANGVVHAINTATGFTGEFAHYQNGTSDARFIVKSSGSVVSGRGSANGTNSSTFGGLNTANGAHAFAVGHFNNSTGSYTFTSGLFNSATGDNSTAMGYYVNANSLGMTAVGINNVVATGTSINTWQGTDPVFVIGNGQGSSPASASTAMTVLKNGNTGVGVTAPITKLEVSGGLRISMESATCSVSYAGTLRYNSGSFELCNGTAWAAVGSSSVTSSTVISALGYTPLASGVASFLVADAGSQASPTVRFSPDASTGFYRFGTNSIGVSVNNTFLARFDSLGLQVQGKISAGNQCAYKICIGLWSAPGNPTPALTDVNQLMGMDRNGPATTVTGNGLYLTAGGAPVAGTNMVGGDLILGSGIATGNATSNIELRTASGTVSGTSDVTPVVRMKILGDGRVGVGTNLPRAGLEVAKSTDTNAAWNNVAIFQASPEAPNGYAGSLAIRSYKDGATSANRKIALQVADSQFVTTIPVGIARDLALQPDGGNVGMGNANPTHVLDVVDNGNDALFKITEFSNTYPADIRVFRARGTQAGPSALQSGDVIGGFNFYGYGETNAPLQRSAAIEAVASQNYTTTARGADLVFRVAASGTVAAAEAMRISQSGNVGIGTTAPSFPLSVSGTIQGRGIGYFTQSSPVNSLAIDATSSTLHSVYTNAPSVDLSLGTNNSTSQLYLKNNGNVGIGTTSPLAKLHVTNGDVWVTGSGDVGAGFSTVNTGKTASTQAYRWTAWNMTGTYGNKLGFYGYSQTDACATGLCINPFSIYDNGNIHMTGNVGIGTTAPGYNLHVVGTAGLSTGTAWTNASDRRLKDIQGDYEYGLNEVLQLHTVRYNYKKNNALKLPSDFSKTGFIAQEVQKVIPDAVNVRKDGYLELNVDPIHWAVVNAVKDLYKLVIEIKNEVLGEVRGLASVVESKADQKEIDQLKAENAKLKAYLCTKDPEASICKQE